MVKNLFWSGGLASTFRLLQILEDSKVEKINLFYTSLCIDNHESSSVRRMNNKNEVLSINKILKLIDTSKINQIVLVGQHPDLVEFSVMLKEHTFLKTIIIDDFQYEHDIINSCALLYDLGIFEREKNQYASISQLLKKLSITAEVCINKDDDICLALTDMVDENNQLVTEFMKTEIGCIFGSFELPLFHINRLEMIEVSTKKNWINILENTWSCWYPLDNKNCGNCHACQTRPLLILPNIDEKKTNWQIVDEIYNIPIDFNYFSRYEIEFINKYFDELIQKKNILSNQYKEVNQMKTTANISTQPKKFMNLLLTLDSIKNQFDEIRIYLNGYKEVPKELLQYTTHIGPDLTDNGKMFWSNNSNEYYFTLDDDIIYPSDYVEKTIPLIQDRIVTYQGKKTTGIGKNYENSHFSYNFFDNLESEKLVDIGTTGLMAFNTNLFKPNLWKTPLKKMCDLIISLEATLFGLQIICLPHKCDWFKMTIEVDSIKKIKPSEVNQIESSSYDKKTAICDMIQLYKNNEIREKDTISKAGTIRKQDVYILNEVIEEMSLDLTTFYHIGSADGKVLCQMSLISNMKKFIGFEFVNERVNFSNSIVKNFSLDNIEFLIGEIWDISFSNKCVVFLNDILMDQKQTDEIYNKLPIGSLFISHNIPEKTLPINSIKTLASWNKFLTIPLYLFLKS